MNRIIISIIIPVYNVEKYIVRCLQSIADQTVCDGVECILIDDCGDDESMQQVHSFLKHYKGLIPFSVLKHHSNMGLSEARNTGIKNAHGDYLLFLDSDDALTSQCISSFTEILQTYSNVDLIQGAYVSTSQSLECFLKKQYPAYTESRKYIKRMLLDYNEMPIMAQNKLVKKTIITNNNLYFKKGIIHEDNHWSFFLAKYVKTMAFNRVPSYIYYINDGSITSSINYEKEIESVHSRIKDFTNSIDLFMSGEQKVQILNTLHHAFSCKYYRSESDKKDLFIMLYDRCNIIEKLFLTIWYRTKCNSFVYRKIFNSIIRVLRLRDRLF